MKNLLRKLTESIKTSPNMLDQCKCGHPFEEHDWGAYGNLETLYSSSCLVEECECHYFQAEEGSND